MQSDIKPDEREAVAWLNETELGRLMKQYGLTIRSNELKLWRPTLRANGEIPGVMNNLTIVATNGILGYFIFNLGDTEHVLCGHIQCFSGKIKPMYSITPPAKAGREPREKREKLPSKSKSFSSIELAMAELRRLTEEKNKTNE